MNLEYKSGFRYVAQAVKKFTTANNSINLPFNSFPIQNRRAKWRKREPPRKSAYMGNNSPSTPMNGPIGTTFTQFPQTTTVTPPSSVESWPTYQTPYELSPHFNLLSPAASPYGSFTTQYGTYVHESQLFPVRQHFDYGSPSRTGTETDEPHHKAEHYASLDDKFDTHCTVSDG